MLSYGECTRYLIIGLTIDGSDSINTTLSSKYGRRFLDIKSYMIQYGLEDMGWTPTTDDTAAINAGSIPLSLISDGPHFKTEVQQQVTAPLICKKLQELYMV